MADAEQDRRNMVHEMEGLEHDKKQIEAENARISEENSELFEQLEGMNKAIEESDAVVQSLSATLENTQTEMRRLTVAASRVAELESQILDLEIEQSELHRQLDTTMEDERSAVQRWKKAECALQNLQDQLDQVEQESREERERHVELLGRMERKRVVERELYSAAARLKGAAATTSMGQHHGSSNVVSHFVRDILQDNAALQMGVVELREMLQNSNEEVLSLRDQLLLHQPLVSEPPAPRRSSSFLSEELGEKIQPANQAFHVHHHYHPPTSQFPPRKEKVYIPIHRRHKKKRSTIPSSLLEQSTRYAAKHSSQNSTSSISTILSQTAASVPPSSAVQPWLSKSGVAPSLPSSVPSSPGSSQRASSIFDRVEHSFDSCPTSPEISGLSLPPANDRRSRGISDVSFRSLYSLSETPGPSIGRDECSDNRDPIDDSAISYFPNVIPEEREELSSSAPDHSTPPDLPIQEDSPGESDRKHEFDSNPSPPRPELIRKSASHESLLSVSKKNIHTGEGLFPYSSNHSRPSHRIASPGTIFSSSPILSTTHITVSHGSLVAGSTQNPRTLLSSVAATSKAGVRGVDHARSDSGSATTSISDVDPSHAPSLPPSMSPTRSAPGASKVAPSIGKRMGGWVFGKWGATPIAASSQKSDTSTFTSFSSDDSGILKSKPEAGSQAEPVREAGPGQQQKSQRKPHKSKSSVTLLTRPPGVNQKGLVPGLFGPPRTPVVLEPAVDRALLKESLEEE